MKSKSDALIAAEAEVKARAEAGEAAQKALKEAKTADEKKSAEAAVAEAAKAYEAAVEARDAQAEADAKASTKAGKKGSAILVKGPRQGRWRVGRKFTAEWTELDLSEISKADREAIEADPVLTVKEG